MIEVAEKRAKKRVSHQQLAEYLSGDTEATYRTPTTDIPSIWTTTRAATRRLSSTVSISWYSDPSGNLFPSLNGSPLSPLTAQRSITAAIRSHFQSTLMRKPDQGSSYRTRDFDPIPSNTWTRDGNFLRFCDWRFIHRARLNLLPLNGARRFDPTSDKRCRRCGAPNETLGHVLSSCVPNLLDIRERHNSIHDRLKKAIRPIPGTVTYHDTVIPGSNSLLRPDVVRVSESEKTVLIVEIHVPFDSGETAIERANEVKRAKYQPLFDHFANQGYVVTFRPLVITALGRLWRGSYEALGALKISLQYSRLMRKLMVADTIKGSRDIYALHMTGQRQ